MTCRTASDLKKQIAADLHISVDNLYIESLPQEAKIEQVSHELIISVLNRCINIEFVFPNGQFFSIPNSYKLEFEEIIFIILIKAKSKFNSLLMEKKPPIFSIHY